MEIYDKTKLGYTDDDSIYIPFVLSKSMRLLGGNHGD
jgi:hypothetical protein